MHIKEGRNTRKLVVGGINSLKRHEGLKESEERSNGETSLLSFACIPLKKEGTSDDEQSSLEEGS